MTSALLVIEYRLLVEPAGTPRYEALRRRQLELQEILGDAAGPVAAAQLPLGWPRLD